MHASSAFILAVAGFAAAQSMSGTLEVSGCGNSIDLIIQSCLGTTQSQYRACTANDWGCLCEQSNNVLTCYNNCPSAPQRFGYEQTKVANCNAASAHPSSSSSTHTGSMTTTMSSSTATATTTPSGTVTETRSGTAATASATQGSGAASVAVPAGLAAVFGFLAFL